MRGSIGAFCNGIQMQTQTWMIMVSVYPQCVVRMMRISLLDVLEGREVLVLVPSLKPSVVGEEGEQEMEEGGWPPS